MPTLKYNEKNLEELMKRENGKFLLERDHYKWTKRWEGKPCTWCLRNNQRCETSPTFIACQSPKCLSKRRCSLEDQELFERIQNVWPNIPRDAFDKFACKLPRPPPKHSKHGEDKYTRLLTAQYKSLLSEEEDSDEGTSEEDSASATDDEDSESDEYEKTPQAETSGSEYSDGPPPKKRRRILRSLIESDSDSDDKLVTFQAEMDKLKEEIEGKAFKTREMAFKLENTKDQLTSQASRRSELAQMVQRLDRARRQIEMLEQSIDTDRSQADSPLVSHIAEQQTLEDVENELQKKNEHLAATVSRCEEQVETLEKWKERSIARETELTKQITDLQEKYERTQAANINLQRDLESLRKGHAEQATTALSGGTNIIMAEGVRSLDSQLHTVKEELAAETSLRSTSVIVERPRKTVEINDQQIFEARAYIQRKDEKIAHLEASILRYETQMEREKELAISRESDLAKEVHGLKDELRTRSDAPKASSKNKNEFYELSRVLAALDLGLASEDIQYLAQTVRRQLPILEQIKDQRMQLELLPL